MYFVGSLSRCMGEWSRFVGHGFGQSRLVLSGFNVVIPHPELLAVPDGMAQAQSLLDTPCRGCHAAHDRSARNHA